ncbi:uncharacterized protein LOC116779817 isoform X1 [Danaus plexippus]|uniref:uncharacterized protein LOC116779817 isoform X1 n=2 Tax=Danaus plexippus TaxID=13037 RepID=UPI002AAF52EF|nr:uncharacterized protein LOC116779817 isoform X1 [Danaus plexippus]
MDVRITTFTNPFSFFCILDQCDESDKFITEIADDINMMSSRNNITTFNHGQYVAVMWNNKWARGVVSLESRLLIWLIDYGVFLRPSNNTIFLDLPSQFRKLPSKIFEASIHGVVPLDKVLTEECRIKNQLATSWTPGTIELAKQLIIKAAKIHFQPIALLSTQHNDVVIGNLYLDIPDKGIVNLVDELNTWPIFLEKNIKHYVANLSNFYITRKIHHACKLKPNITFKLPLVTLQLSLENYLDIIENKKADSTLNNMSVLDDTSTLIDFTKPEKYKSKHKISPEDIQKYANRYIFINGSEHNVLTILINKARDLNMCERYKDYDLKSIGRGISNRASTFDKL